MNFQNIIYYFFLFILLVTFLIGICVVNGETESLLLYINITSLAEPVFFDKYSVMPEYLFLDMIFLKLDH